MEWRAWYTEGRVFNSLSAQPQELPSSGVIAIVMYDETGRRRLTGGDWYYWKDNQWKYVSSKDWGTDQPKPDIPCVSCIKKGVGVSDKEFLSILEETLIPWVY